MESAYELRYELGSSKNLEIATEIQQTTWPDDPDYQNLCEKATNPTENNCFFLIYDGNVLVGLTGFDFYDEYPETIWLDWFTILPEYRRKGYGKKVLLDTIQHCKSLKRYDYFRLDTTYYENRPALFLYDEIMHLKESYTAEDTEGRKNNFLIYTYSLHGKMEPWNNRYLGLKEYYGNCH